MWYRKRGKRREGNKKVNSTIVRPQVQPLAAPKTGESAAWLFVMAQATATHSQSSSPIGLRLAATIWCCTPSSLSLSSTSSAPRPHGGYPYLPIGHRIVTSPAEGMAAADPADRNPGAAERAVPPQRLKRAGPPPRPTPPSPPDHPPQHLPVPGHHR